MKENAVIQPNDKDRLSYTDPTPFPEHPLFVMGDTLMKAFYEVSELTQGLSGDRPVNIDAHMELLQRDLLAKILDQTSQPESYIIHGENWSQHVQIDPGKGENNGYVSVRLYIPPLSDEAIFRDKNKISNASVELCYSRVLSGFQEILSLNFFEPGKYSENISYGMMYRYGLLKNGDHMLQLFIFHGKPDNETYRQNKEYEFHKFLDKDGNKLTDEEMEQRGYSLGRKYLIF